MKAIWKSIGDTLYEVSNDGRVRSSVGLRPRILKPGVVGGYLRVSLGRDRGEYVHRLVLQVFVGECPEGEQACHNNGKKTANRLLNLRWDTPVGNYADKRKHGTHLEGADAPWATLTAASVRSILRSRRAHSDLASRYGVGRSTISKIKRGERWCDLHEEELAAGRVFLRGRGGGRVSL